MKRNKHSLSHYRLLTADMGRLVPIGCYDVLPGDTVQQATSLLLRVSPLMAPVMHPVSVRVHHWFVPYRLVWDGWEDFITGGADGLGGDAGQFPSWNVGSSPPGPGSVADYMGVPPNTPNLDISLLPFRAYFKIWNEFYRDQDLQDELPLDGGGDQPPYVAWEKDYFTASRPWPQKGPDVSLPLGISAPVVGSSTEAPSFKLNGTQDVWLAMEDTQNQVVGSGPNSTGSWSTLRWSNPQLHADLTNASAVNVNDVRRAFALQRYQEARAQYGSRYTEYLRYLGVRSSDARLQRPEYLGGGKQTIQFSEVLQTGPGSTEGSPIPGGVGQMAGHGISAMRSRRYRRFFEEHGVVVSLLSVRPRAIYTNGLHRMFSKRTKEEYWQRELEQIGQQEVFRREVFAEGDNAGSGGDAIFGYNDRYAEYKHQPSTVHAEFRQLMNYWHMARDFAQAPALNETFVACDPTKRVYAEQTQHPLWIMVNHSIQARRMVRSGSNSRIL